jgi:2'-5' RNA ligase
MASQRLFVALMLGTELGATVEAAVLRSLGGESARGAARVYGAADLHLTLFFLGGVDASWVGALERALATLAAVHPAPELALGRSGAFPNERRPRILWLDVLDRGGGLAQLQADVDGACASLGFARDERPWKPHLTVARIRDRVQGGIERFLALDMGALEIEADWKPLELALVESVPGGGPPAYRPLFTARFRPG